MLFGHRADKLRRVEGQSTTHDYSCADQITCYSSMIGIRKVQRRRGKGSLEGNALLNFSLSENFLSVGKISV